MLSDNQIKIENNSSKAESEYTEYFKFRERLDADGVREVITIGNERKGGCPFSCIGCGVHSKVMQVQREQNGKCIAYALHNLSARMKNNQDQIQKYGYHVCVYNEGSITNEEELSRENLFSLLQSLGEINPSPKFVSLNSRGVFVDQGLLDSIEKLDLPFDVHFILGVESLTRRGSEIYGKKNMAKELEGLFHILRNKNQEPNQKRLFGIDAGFVYLPEFYLEEGKTRDDKERVKQGFVGDVSLFIKQYVGKGVPIKINLHPYYKISSLPYEDSCDSFNEFMQGVAELFAIVSKVNKDMPEKGRATLFIGVQGVNYGEGKWVRVLDIWNDVVNKINAIHDYDSEECKDIVKEINDIVVRNTIAKEGNRNI